MYPFEIIPPFFCFWFGWQSTWPDSESWPVFALRKGGQCSGQCVDDESGMLLFAGHGSLPLSNPRAFLSQLYANV